MHPSIGLMFDLKSYLQSYPIKAEIFLHEEGETSYIGSFIIIKKGDEQSEPYGYDRLITEMEINIEVCSGQLLDTDNQYAIASELIDQIDTALITVQPSQISSYAMAVRMGGSQDVNIQNKELETSKIEKSYIFTYKRKITDAEVA